jgi:hypothetical protein
VSSIEGIPEGWELVRFGVPQNGDWLINSSGHPEQSKGKYTTVWPIIRKIEKPKTYRPFANAAEFEPHRDRWIKQTLGDSVSFTRIDGYGKEGVTIQGNAYTYQHLLDNRTFDDGSPFGVEVTE